MATETERVRDAHVEVALYHLKRDIEVQDRILKKARELRMPIRRQDVEVRKPGSRIFMRVRYNVPLEFPFYTYDWDFDLVVERNIYII